MIYCFSDHRGSVNLRCKPVLVCVLAMNSQEDFFSPSLNTKIQIQQFSTFSWDGWKEHVYFTLTLKVYAFSVPALCSESPIDFYSLIFALVTLYPVRMKTRCSSLSLAAALKVKSGINAPLTFLVSYFHLASDSHYSLLNCQLRSF